MTEREARIKRMIEQASGYMEANIDPSLERVWRYYNGEVDATPMGYMVNSPINDPQFEGSKIVVTEVADVVNGITPDIFRVFAGSDEAVRFEPNDERQVAMAKQQTDYANHVVWRENKGHRLVNDLINAWAMKFTAVRVWWDYDHQDHEQAFEGLTELEVQMLAEDDEVISIDATPEGYVQVPQPQDMPPMPPQGAVGPQAEARAMVQPHAPQQPPAMTPGPMLEATYSGTLVRRKTTGRIRIRQIKQEELLIDGEAENLDDCAVLGINTYMRKGELLAMGVSPEIVERASSQGVRDGDLVSDARAGYSTQFNNVNATGDDSMEWVRVVDARVKLDDDEDGIAEDYMILAVGEGLELARFEPDPKSSFIIVDSPLTIPHEIIGRGIGETVIDLQDQQTAYHRRLQDSLNRSVWSRWMTDSPDTKTYNDLVSVFGGPVRVAQGSSVTPLTVPFVGQAIQPYLGLLDQRRVLRTGISPASQGLDPNVLKGQTVEAAQAIVTADQDRVEYFVRRFADGIMGPIFDAIVRIAAAFQDKATVIKSNGAWVPVDPRQWVTGMQVTSRVGLGTGTLKEQFAALQIIAQKQEALLAQGSVLVTMTEYRRTIADMCAALSIKDADRYFRNPSPAELQQAQAQKQQAAKADQQQNTQQQIALITAQENAQAQAKAQADLIVNKAKIEAQAQADQLKAQTDLERTRVELEYQAQKDAADRAMQLEIKRLELEMKYRVEVGKLNAMQNPQQETYDAEGQGYGPGSGEG